MLAYVLQIDRRGTDRARTPRISGQMQGKKQLPPSARCNAHVEVWRAACGVWSVKWNVHVHVHVYVYVHVQVYVQVYVYVHVNVHVYVYVQCIEMKNIWFRLLLTTSDYF